LSVTTSTSTARNFENVVFVDTPGLADGNLQYKFDVDEVYMWLARHCDLILVFLDPIGMALCSRTNTFLKRLHQEGLQTEVKYYLTKGDIFKTQ
jgi:GTPase Era involved in 16S rRNA processing